MAALKDLMKVMEHQTAEEVIEMAGGLTERESSGWYCELPANLAKKQRLARRQKEASDKINTTASQMSCQNECEACLMMGNKSELCIIDKI